ncbi:MAG: RsmB/NOP family class I SAM-dependent RNA methyltransferase [Pseudomonadota bacterium]
MTPGARVAAAIEVVDRWAAGVPGGPGLDRVLAEWGRRNRYAGSGDRRAVADLAYDAVRRLRSALWMGGAGPAELPPTHPAPPGRPALIGSLKLDGADLSALFTGQGHAPAQLRKEDAPGVELSHAPKAVQLDIPDWLEEHDRLGALPYEALDRLRHRATVHLRVNLLKGNATTGIETLAEDGVAAVPGPLSPTCVTVMEGARRVRTSRAYQDGLVEVQDAASQAVADLCTTTPGMRVLDLCAGAGGKTLAIAATAQNAVELVAHDVDERRLAQLPPRAARAGAKIRCEPNRAALPEGNDLVLVDAPCSGSGAWARNPDAKWSLTSERLDWLRETQATVLRQAAGFLAPGGRIVYATCSLMPLENERIVDDFVASTPAFTLNAQYQWTPLDRGDGFFAACLTAPG